MSYQESNTANSDMAWSPDDGAYAPVPAPSPGSLWLDRLSISTLLVLIFLQPLLFGGVHLPVFYACSFLALLAASASLFNWRESLHALEPYRWIFASLSAFALLVMASFILPIHGGTAAHPVTGQSPGLPDYFAARNYLLGFLGFVGTLCLTLCWLSRSSRRLERLPDWLCLMAFLTGLTALCHWFYDNGKLFWTFEPEYIFISTRARWPFVNPDHLAAFLLPGFFLILGRLVVRLHQHYASGHTSTLSQLASSKRSQAHLISAAFNGLALAVVLVTIAGSLSRGAWFGLAIASLLFYACMRTIGAPQATLNVADNSNPYADSHSGQHSASNHRRHRHRRSRSTPRMQLPAFSRLAQGLLLIFVIALLVMFLGARGGELLMQRIDFGLMYTKDDIRWQMYSDTLKMIADHLFWGVGPGGWAASYPRYMNQLLSGINPVYLHSVPLQLLAEMGIAGVILLLCPFLLVLERVVKAIHSKAASAKIRIKTAAVFSGLSALLLASCFDFPLNIPAVASSMAIFLALLLHYSNLGLQEIGQTSASPAEKSETH